MIDYHHYLQCGGIGIIVLQDIENVCRTTAAVAPETVDFFSEFFLHRNDYSGI